MVRQIKLIIEYDGTGYVGWQSQPNGIAIQDVITKVLKRILQHPVTLYGASRTDAGVHALGQVATFFTEKKITSQKMMGALNGLLPEELRIVSAEEVPESFHPRKDARWKEYQYKILNGTVPTALDRNRCWHISKPLDWKAIQKAAKFLEGKHDFAAFQASGSEVKETVRTLKEINFPSFVRRGLRGGRSTPPQPSPYKWEGVSIIFIGNGFLKQMVRNIVGTLVEVGLGKREPDSMKKILAGKDRRKAGRTAPPQGLYLVRIKY